MLFFWIQLTKKLRFPQFLHGDCLPAVLHGRNCGQNPPCDRRYYGNEKPSGKDRSAPSKLEVNSYGQPSEVLEMKEIDEEDLEISSSNADEVLLRVLASPINPADINTIEGTYPNKPRLPMVPGMEGLAEVCRVGQNVCNFKPGDRVIPLTTTMGWWRTHMTVPAINLYQVPCELGIPEASTLSINPCTAYRMLKDFTCLEKGDAVLQNGANSAVGQLVIQLCKHWGFISVNVVRDRPDFQKIADCLKCLGADYVLKEHELKTTKIFRYEKLPKPKLGLNCVGGSSGNNLMKHLANDSYLVTYGGMSRKPLNGSVTNLVFKGIKMVGFWLTGWNKENFKSKEQFEMLDEIVCLMMEGKLSAPIHEMVPFKSYHEAICKTIDRKGRAGRKFILSVEDVE